MEASSPPLVKLLVKDMSKWTGAIFDILVALLSLAKQTKIDSHTSFKHEQTFNSEQREVVFHL